jgi:hypothetical protein
MDPNDLFKGWFSALGGFKSPIGAMGLILPGSPGAVVYQNYYKGCYKNKQTNKKWSHM